MDVFDFFTNWCLVCERQIHNSSATTIYCSHRCKAHDFLIKEMTTDDSDDLDCSSSSDSEYCSSDDGSSGGGDMTTTSPTINIGQYFLKMSSTTPPPPPLLSPTSSQEFFLSKTHKSSSYPNGMPRLKSKAATRPAASPSVSQSSLFRVGGAASSTNFIKTPRIVLPG